MTQGLVKSVIQVGILGFSRRDGTFSEVGLRSWEEAGCAAVEAALMQGSENVFVVHRPLVIRITRADVERILRDWCDSPNVQMRCHLILTVGATGYSALDVVPEATTKLIKCEALGIAELLRRTVAEAGYPLDGVSRGMAGTRGRTLLINLPGQLQGLAAPEPLTAATKALLPVLPDLIASLQ
jgi:molybdopterin biosynthesis enzyme MoaB